jgi:hypothetical protein
VIIFKEGDQPFDPLCLTTQFNHIFCVVQVDKRYPQKTHYKYVDPRRDFLIHFRVAFANKASVPPYSPFLKSPPVYEKTDEFRDFFLTKLVNSERASLLWAGDFRTKMIRTQKQILEDLAKEFIAKSKTPKSKHERKGSATIVSVDL